MQRLQQGHSQHKLEQQQDIWRWEIEAGQRGLIKQRGAC
jgi:hypothetical protein